MDFHRGERPVQLMFNGAVAPSPSGPNPTMYPISDTGPYYAALVVGATLGPIFAFAYRAARAADRERAAAPAAAR